MSALLGWKGRSCFGLVLVLWVGVVFDFVECGGRMGASPPCNPPMQIQLREEKVQEGGKGVERAGACGARWPSGARSSRPRQAVQGLGPRVAPPISKVSKRM